MTDYNTRRLKDRLVLALCFASLVFAMIPLGSILFEVVRNGAPALSVDFLTSPPSPLGQQGGGVGTAIQGTLILIGLTSLITVPVGVMSGVYLAEFGTTHNSRLLQLTARTIRLFNDVLASFPSIVVGIFVYVLIVIAIGRFSTIAGAIALSIIMLPIVTRTTEESVKLVPSTIREASLALGIRRWRTIVSVVLTSARSGLITGIMIAVSRIAGETAPLIMTILGSELFFTGLAEPMDALPLRIWRLALLPSDYARQQAWAAALVLILIVLALNVTVRMSSRGRHRIGK